MYSSSCIYPYDELLLGMVDSDAAMHNRHADSPLRTRSRTLSTRSRTSSSSSHLKVYIYIYGALNKPRPEEGRGIMTHDHSKASSMASSSIAPISAPPAASIPLNSQLPPLQPLAAGPAKNPFTYPSIWRQPPSLATQMASVQSCGRSTAATPHPATSDTSRSAPTAAGDGLQNQKELRCVSEECTCEYI